MSTRKTASDEIASIREAIATRRDDSLERIAILALLPLDIDAPTVSNTHSSHLAQMGLRAWLSFSRPTWGDLRDAYSPHGILSELEAHGWKTCPATLVKLDNYRREPKPGDFDKWSELETFGKYSVAEAAPICPVWASFSKHTGCDLHCFMEAPSGDVFQVSIDATHPHPHLTGRRVNYRGGWRYERGSGRLSNIPQSWQAVHLDDGQSIAGQDRHTFGSVFHYGSDPGHLDGRFYWEPYTEEAITHSAADFVRCIGRKLDPDDV